MENEELEIALKGLTDAVKRLTEEVSDLNTIIANHFNPDYHPNVANEIKKLNSMLPGLIEALNKRGS